MRPFAHLFLLVVTPCLAFGCASGKASSSAADGANGSINAWLEAHEDRAVPGVYRVGPPDKLKILAPRIKEINGCICQVRSDGIIAVNLIGEVKVSGLTPAEIADLLAQKLAAYYQKDALDIAVQIAEFKSKVLFVIGQVVAGGPKPYTGNDTVINVLAEAKLNGSAWPQKVVIVRANEDPHVRQRVTVDVEEMFETGSTTQNFLLEEGDVVYIPASPLAKAGLVFRQVIYPLIPVSNLAMMAAGL